MLFLMVLVTAISVAWANREGLANLGASSPVDDPFFKNTKFSYDCCPSTYSSSMGCACMSQDQLDILKPKPTA